MKTDDIDGHMDAAQRAPGAHDTVGPFSIGHDATWPGISKLIEECGEVLQVCGKLIATGGRTDHWSGVDLAEELTDELADLLAAIRFVRQHNEEIKPHRLLRRMEKKLELFEQWHKQYTIRSDDDRHFVIFSRDRWTVEHSLACRRSGHMHECEFHSAVVKAIEYNDGELLPTPIYGRWEIVGVLVDGFPEFGDHG